MEATLTFAIRFLDILQLMISGNQSFSVITFLILAFCASTGYAQDAITNTMVNYGEPQEYEIGEVKITGANYSDENAIRVVTGLRSGKKIKIPGPEITRAIKALWKQKLFTDIQILKEKVIGDVVFLEIILQERPRLAKFTYKGAKKVNHEDLNELMEPYLLRGGIVTDATKVNAKTAIENFYIKKGYLDVKVTPVEQVENAERNTIQLEFQVERNEKIKVEDITFSGVSNASEKKLRKQMQNTKRRKKILSS
ncbi:MAG: hypothetical protein OEQ53_09480, partial [Saprospiraceae bacterium]|nr:hypothetical protein [Saprospiraceae bacterium]